MLLNGWFSARPGTRSHLKTLLLFLLLLCGLLPAMNAQVNVATYHNDNARTGRNSLETILTPANVNADNFGRIITYPVDGYVYAQPLYLHQITIPGKGKHNVVFVATQHNSLYAFDADSFQPALWSVNFGPSLPNGDVGTEDIVPEIGITGTPVIDAYRKILFVVSKTKETVQGNTRYVQRLHAIDVTTGAEEPGSPTEIQAVVNGIGDGNDGQGHVPFDVLRQNQRPALLQLGHVIYIAWASHGDNIPYHGWVMGYNYDGQKFTQTSVFNSTPNGVTDPSGYPLGAGGIWMAGGGPASDAAGNIYFEVGNGSFDPNSLTANAPNGNYGDSFVKLSAVNGVLKPADFFAPLNESWLNNTDTDLGSGGLVVLPNEAGNDTHRHLLIGAGKEGKIYLVDRDNMGLFNIALDNVVQEMPNAIGGSWSTPAYFKNKIYYGGVGDVLKAFSISNATLSSSPIAQSPTGYGYPGATPSVSSNGLTNGIVWAVENASNAVLHAYNAENISQELYNSEQSSGRDSMSGPVKFSVPTIADGKVFVGSQYNLNIFGQGKWTPAPAISPAGGEFRNPVTISISDSMPSAVIYYTTDGTDPTPASTRYTGSFTVQNCAQVRARAIAPGYSPSGMATDYYMVDAGPGNGDGLYATYFGNIDLTGTTVTHIDPTVDFNWNGNAPIAGIGGSNWSARWTGTVQARCTADYTFYTISDDGVRLWVDNKLVIDDWTYHGPTTDQAVVHMQADQTYAIRMEFFQGGGGSMAQLLWSNLGMPVQTIPQSQFYSGHVAKPRILPNGGTFKSSVKVTLACDTAGVDIRYTLNGAAPTTSSTQYTTPFTLTSTTLLKVAAFKTGLAASDAAAAQFTRNDAQATYQINAGGGDASPFTADRFFDAGGTYAPGGAIDTSLVTQPAPQAVYGSERYGNMTYTLPNLIPRLTYTVRLHFAEIYFSAPGQRIFNVAINGTPVLSNFDIVSQAGSSFRAIAEDFSAAANSSGVITIAFTNVVDNPKISGIEVIPPGNVGKILPRGPATSKGL